MVIEIGLIIYITIIFLVIVLLWVFENSLFEVPQGEYGSYEISYTECNNGGIECANLGKRYKVQTCVPNPTTMYGCKDLYGKMSYSSIITQETCVEKCRTSDWVITPMVQKKGVSSECVDEENVSVKMSNYVCEMIDGDGLNYCYFVCNDQSNFWCDACVGHNGETLYFNPGDTLLVSEYIDPGVPICGNWLMGNQTCLKKSGVVISDICFKKSGEAYSSLTDIYNIGWNYEELSCSGEACGGITDAVQPTEVFDKLAIQDKVYVDLSNGKFGCCNYCLYYSDTQFVYGKGVLIQQGNKFMSLRHVPKGISMVDGYFIPSVIPDFFDTYADPGKTYEDTEIMFFSYSSPAKVIGSSLITFLIPRGDDNSVSLLSLFGSNYWGFIFYEGGKFIFRETKYKFYGDFIDDIPSSPQFYISFTSGTNQFTLRDYSTGLTILDAIYAEVIQNPSAFSNIDLLLNRGNRCVQNDNVYFNYPPLQNFNCFNENLFTNEILSM